MGWVLRSIVQCPHCGFKVTERMPVQGRVEEWACQACQQTLKVDEEKCCVFCCYGSVPCPSRQGKTAG